MYTWCSSTLVLCVCIYTAMTITQGCCLSKSLANVDVCLASWQCQLMQIRNSLKGYAADHTFEQHCIEQPPLQSRA